jgi:hypothetical protein
MNKITWEIPLKTIGESNCTEHWTKKSKRHIQQQFFIRSLFNHETSEIHLPCVIRMVRLSSRLLDDDSIPTAFKWIRDELAACIFPNKVVIYKTKNGKVKENKGFADSDQRITWEYSQEKSKIQGIRIEISFLSHDKLIDTVRE